MIKVGLTGGIGSGKTYLANIFSHLGIPIYYSDDRTKSLYKNNPQLKSNLISEFGHQVYLPSGEINKDFLRKIIFDSPGLRTKINQIVHPFVIADFQKWYNLQKNVPYILKESALLFETNLFKTLNKTILIKASNELKIKRLKKRDNLSVSEIQQKMATQLSDTEKTKKADFVIFNDEKKLLLPQILTIHKQLLDIK